MTIMKKKVYIAPCVKSIAYAEELMEAASALLPGGGDSQQIVVSTDEEAEEFTSRAGTLWDDEF